MNSEEKMLHDIGIADFVLTDLMLYLDTHSPHRPECHGVFQPLCQNQDTDGAGILQRILPPAERSGRK